MPQLWDGTFADQCLSVASRKSATTSLVSSRWTVKTRIFSIFQSTWKRTRRSPRVYGCSATLKRSPVNRNTSVKHVRANKKQRKGARGLRGIQIAFRSNRMRIKKLPRILALHLKRFKYFEVFKQYKKLSYRVVFPFELRLLNTVRSSVFVVEEKHLPTRSSQCEDCTNSDRIYDLVSLVVHCGIGPNRGHYIAVVKRENAWLVFDDETVDVRLLLDVLPSLFFASSDWIRRISKNSTVFLTILVVNPRPAIFYSTKVEMSDQSHVFSLHRISERVIVFLEINRPTIMSEEDPRRTLEWSMWRRESISSSTTATSKRTNSVRVFSLFWRVIRDLSTWKQHDIDVKKTILPLIGRTIRPRQTFVELAFIDTQQMGGSVRGEKP